MYAYGKNLVALKMSFHNVGAIVQDAQSSCKRQDAAFAATRPAYKQCVLIFQSDLVLPISVQILHISHSLPVSTPLFQQISIYKIPSPSRSTLRPIRISITPPQISAFDWYLLPKILPIFTPRAEQTKVTTPINDTAGIIFT